MTGKLAAACALTWLVCLSLPAPGQQAAPAEPPVEGVADTEVTSIDLPFDAARVAVSADGARAAVWDVPRSQNGPQNLAIVDLRRRQLVSQAILPHLLLDVVLGDDVYIASDRKITRLSPDGLEPLAAFDLGNVPTSFSRFAANSRQRPTQSLLMLVANRRLSAGPRLRFALPNLTPIENYDHDINSADGWLDGRGGFGWLAEGVLWDHTFTRPLLLVWPYEFQRSPWQNVLRASDRGPGDFQPRTGTWHPFATRFSGARNRRGMASATSPDIAATLHLVKEPDGVYLTSARLDNGQQIAGIRLLPPDVVPGNPPVAYSAISTGGDRFAVLVKGRLLVGSLQRLRGHDPAPFHLVPLQSTLVLNAVQPTTVRYQADGAVQFRLVSRSLGSHENPFETASETGEFTLSVADSLERVLSRAAGLAANLNQGRNLADNRQRAEHLASPSRAVFRRLTGREAEGVPLPIDIQVTAEGPDSETATLRHDFLVDVPLPRLEEALDRTYPSFRDPWKMPAERFDITNYPAATLPPSGQGALFTYLNGVWSLPHSELAGEPLRQAAARAKTDGDRRLSRGYAEWIANKQWRTWTDVEGRRSEGLLVKYFAGQVTLRSRLGFELTFDDSKLAKADRKYLLDLKEPTTPDDSDDWREFAMQQALQALIRFESAHKFLPPWALTDAAGQPRLSWRVLLLGELGYAELFALFHFDEPWNSEHNRMLIPFMPDSLAVDPQLPLAGSTTLLTITSPLAAFPNRGVSARGRFGRELSATVTFVEGVPARATPWTRPADLGLYEFASPDQVVRVRNERTLVGLLDGQTRYLRSDTSPDEWRFAVNRGDGRQTIESVAPKE